MDSTCLANDFSGRLKRCLAPHSQAGSIEICTDEHEVSIAVNHLSEAFRAADPRPDPSAKRGAKKNYAESLSRHLSTAIAAALRPRFPGIMPDADGGRQESLARSSKGFKRLDVNYSTPDLGLGLGVSIKTLNFRDQKSSRYTKNYTRIDNELRAEALDYHVRQPYAVLAGVVFLPVDSCDDGKAGPSSFGQSVKIFRHRGGRDESEDSPELFERLFVGLYDYEALVGALPGEDSCVFFDVMDAPPKARRPRRSEVLGFDEMIAGIVQTYDLRNEPPFEWAPDE